VTTNSYTDTSLAVGATWYYVVQAVAQVQANAPLAQSFQSSEASATTLIAAPTGLAGSQSNHNAQLSWNASDGATSYIVSRADALAGPYTQVGTPTSPSFFEQLTGTIAPVYYTVVATDGSHPSSPSAPLTVNPRQFCVIEQKKNQIEQYDETQASGSTALLSGFVNGDSGCGSCNRYLASDISTHSLFVLSTNLGNLYALDLPLSCPSGTCTTRGAPLAAGGGSWISVNAGLVLLSNGAIDAFHEDFTTAFTLPTSAVAVDADPNANELFVLHGSQVDVYDLTSLTLKRSGTPTPPFSGGPIAIATSAGSFYVGDNSGKLYQFISMWSGTTLTQVSTATVGKQIGGISVDLLGGVIRVPTNASCGNARVYTLPLDLSSSSSFYGSWGSTSCQGPTTVTLCN
jgi:hypothetical protein